MKVILSAIFLLFCSGFPMSAHARCRVEPERMDQAIKAADVIFFGEVLKIDGETAHLSVQRWWKGKPEGFSDETKEYVIQVWSPAAWHACKCRLHFEVGQRYAIFAKARDDGKLQAGVDDGSMLIENSERPDSRFRRRLRALRKWEKSMSRRKRHRK